MNAWPMTVAATAPVTPKPAETSTAPLASRSAPPPTNEATATGTKRNSPSSAPCRTAPTTARGIHAPMARFAKGEFRLRNRSVSGASASVTSHRPDTPEGGLHRQARSDTRPAARAGDDGLRHGELNRAKRDGEHGDDVQDGGKRPVLRRAEQAADQNVEEEIKPADPRRGDDQGPAALTEQPGRDTPAPRAAVAAPVPATARFSRSNAGEAVGIVTSQVSVRQGCSDPVCWTVGPLPHCTPVLFELRGAESRRFPVGGCYRAVRDCWMQPTPDGG